MTIFKQVPTYIFDISIPDHFQKPLLATMKVNIVSKKLIKPCTPTPTNLKKHKLCFMDENMLPLNLGVVLFYGLISSYDDNLKKKQIHQLEESLSEILTQFYPLAGRYMKSDGFVDCSDQGAEFVQAEADDVDFIDLVSKMEHEHINDLLPSHYNQLDESPTNPLLSIQITDLKLCGGLVISVSISHRIFDGYSIGTFIAAWSNANSNNNNNNPGGRKIEICPSFESQSLLWPAGGRSSPSIVADSLMPTETCDIIDAPSPRILTHKRFCFNKDAITSLRSKLVSGTKYYSRVRVVCGIVSKALMSLDQAKHGGKSRGCLIVQPINIRERTIPPLPMHSCGNVSILSSTRCMSETDTMGIQEFVNIIGDGLEKTIADCAEIFSPGGGGRDAHSIIMDPVMNLIEKESSGQVNIIVFSDWSKFGFYKTDFGWGMPVGAGIGATPSGENVVVLMDSKDGDGIEAWVHLNRDDMAYFEQDHDIKLFTT